MRTVALASSGSRTIVLLRRHRLGVPFLRLVDDGRNLARLIAVVVGEGMARDHGAAALLQRLEELFGPPDAGEGDDRSGTERAGLLAGHQIGVDHGQIVRPERRESAPPVVPDENERMGPAEPAGERLAQRPGRQHATIAEARAAVDDRET